MDRKLERILLATDFSSDSFAALEYSISLAREHLCEVVLVHVVEPLPRGAARWQDPSELLEGHAEQARIRLEYFEKRALARYGRCRSELHFGTASRVIADLAGKLEVGLIVVSARRRTGIFDRLLEGLPEKLVRKAPCPVLAVRPRTEALGDTPNGVRLTPAFFQPETRSISHQSAFPVLARNNSILPISGNCVRSRLRAAGPLCKATIEQSQNSARVI